MPSQCTLGCNAGSLLDRPGGPVLPEYTYKAIHKCNTKSFLMCLVYRLLVVEEGLEVEGDHGHMSRCHGIYSGFWCVIGSS